LTKPSNDFKPKKNELTHDQNKANEISGNFQFTIADVLPTRICPNQYSEFCTETSLRVE
jgi:hypothetical protein